MNNMSSLKTPLILFLSLIIILPPFNPLTIQTQGLASDFYLEYTTISDKFIAIFGNDESGYGYYSVDLLDKGFLRIEIEELDLSVKEIRGYFEGEVNSFDYEAKIEFDFVLLLYKNNVFFEDMLLGFSPFYFDIPVTFDYLLSGNVQPSYLGYPLEYPDKPVNIKGYMGFNVIIIYSKNTLTATKITQDVLAEGRVSLPVYEAEIRGRFPLTVKVVIPSYVLDEEAVFMIKDLVSQLSGVNVSTLRYIFLDLGLSDDYVNNYRDVIVNEPLCIHMCPSIRLSPEAIAIIILTASIVAMVVLIKRVGL